MFQIVLMGRRSGGAWLEVEGENMRRSDIENFILFQKRETAFCKFSTSVKNSISMTMKLLCYNTKMFI